MDVSLAPPTQPPRKSCAVYTRKSSDHGLQQDFNSLKAQQAVCSAYIESQQHRGWVELEKTYEDAAQSGSTLERPAMKALLADIERGRVDVVVVYKLDRLSRSLLDFVSLIDVFQRYDVSFVCITQNFDTGDSLGRLVMNVLLTFAQFEREMTGDRIRDKKRAMAMKGLWPGGRAPLGYDLIDHHLVVNAAEAVMRISAPEVDRIAVSAIQNFLTGRAKLRALLTDLGRSASELRSICRKAPVASRRLEAISSDQLRSVVHGLITRVEVSRERLKFVTRALEFEQLINWDFVGHFRRRTEDSGRSPAHILDIPCAGTVRLERVFRLPIAPRKGRAARVCKGLRKLISDARSAWALVEDHRDLSPTQLASQCKVSVGHFMRLLRVNYLAPDILTSIMDGTQPQDLTRKKIIGSELPLDWALQRTLFGYCEQPPMKGAEKY